MIRHLLAAAASLAALAIAGPASAQVIAITNARIETAGPAGPIARGTIVFDQSRIVAVGPNVIPPAGAFVIDGTGKVVSPGIILPSSSLGVAEIEQVPSTRDDSAGPKLGAGFDPSAGVNPDADMVALARRNGVTRAIITPVLGRGGGGAHAHDDAAFEEFSGSHGGDSEPSLFAGQAASLVLRQAGMVVRPGVGVVLDMGEAGAVAAGGSRGASFVLLRQTLADVRHFIANRARYDAGEGRGLLISRLDLEALIPIVQGRAPLLVRVSRASDIRAVLDLARTENLRIVLEGAEEGWRVASDLAAMRVPVIIDAQASLPSSFETLASTMRNATLLDRAGVRVAIMGSRDYNNLRQSRFNAGVAVSYGLPWQTALRAVTLTPAQIWGQEAATGSLEVGKAADVVVWTGDPLETQSYPTQVFIGGVEQTLESRASALAARYRPTPPGALPPGYRN